MMMGLESPHTLLHTTDCLDSRITAIKSNKGERKEQKKLLRKLGAGLEKTRRAFESLPPSQKEKQFMQKDKDFPCSAVLVKPKNKKNPLHLQHQYAYKGLLAHLPSPRLAFWHG
jgi:hypothetical protein